MATFEPHLADSVIHLVLPARSANVRGVRLLLHFLHPEEQYTFPDPFQTRSLLGMVGAGVGWWVMIQVWTEPGATLYQMSVGVIE